VPIPGTKYKRLNSIFFVTSIVLICGRVWSQLLQHLAQSLIRSPGTLFVTMHKAGSRWRIPVFRPCVVEPLRFLHSVCAFSTLTAGTPETYVMEYLFVPDVQEDHQSTSCQSALFHACQCATVWTPRKGLLLATVRFRCAV